MKFKKIIKILRDQDYEVEFKRENWMEWARLYYDDQYILNGQIVNHFTIDEIIADDWLINYKI